MYLGIEIGGTKLQLGLGEGDGNLAALWRGCVDSAAGGPGILRQIEAAIPEVLQQIGLECRQLHGIGVGFGGPTDDARQAIIKSHHVAGWDAFPLSDWLENRTGVPTVIGNDADVAGLAEAHHGAGRGFSPILYMTIGTGIGGGLCIDGQMYRGCGRGAVEIGHLIVRGQAILESFASGWGIAARARDRLTSWSEPSLLRSLGDQLTARHVADAARAGDALAGAVLADAIAALAEAIQQVIKLLCPRRVVIGGGVSLIGEERFFDPLRRLVAENCFPPFRGLTEIVPAQLGEEVVVHGALLLARQQCSHRRVPRSE